MPRLASADIASPPASPPRWSAWPILGEVASVKVPLADTSDVAPSAP
jgi:hypothetical protein